MGIADLIVVLAVIAVIVYFVVKKRKKKVVADSAVVDDKHPLHGVSVFSYSIYDSSGTADYERCVFNDVNCEHALNNAVQSLIHEGYCPQINVVTVCGLLVFYITY